MPVCRQLTGSALGGSRYLLSACTQHAGPKGNLGGNDPGLGWLARELSVVSSVWGAACRSRLLLYAAAPRACSCYLFEGLAVEVVT